MDPVIGWYVHHHGGGHLARMLAVRPHLDAEVVCFSSLPAPAVLPPRTRWVELPGDADGPPPADPTVGGMLHWAPLGHAGHRARLAAIAGELAMTALVVDVSAEVALLGRLLGIPVVLFTQPGDRSDEPHTLAFRAASRILAPWPREMLEPRHLAPVLEKTVFVGGISRFAERERHPRGDGVVLLAGRGGSAVTPELVAGPGAEWTVLGMGEWHDDPWPLIAAADVVVSFAGQNAIADLAVAGARAVVIPQERPFAEQRTTAEALARGGLAVVEPAWPDAERWPGLLDRARKSTPDWSAWGTSGAAARAAAAIAEVAG